MVSLPLGGGGSRRSKSVAARQPEVEAYTPKIRQTDTRTERERDRQGARGRRTDRRTHTVPHAASRQGDSELAQVYVTGQDCFWKSPTLNSVSAHKIPLFFSLQAPALPRVVFFCHCGAAENGNL